MKKSLFSALALMSAVAWSSCQKETLTQEPQNVKLEERLATYRPPSGSSSPLISTVFDYLPGAGQFISKSPYGTAAAAQLLVNSTTNMVSLGGWGGYIVFGFDHSVDNSAGNDIGIYGNPLGSPWNWSEPGIVMVSQDVNNNGVPDDAWYELAGSEYSNPATIKNYRITYYNPYAVGTSVKWKSNQGDSGYVAANAFHTTNNYYPTFAPNLDSISFTGTKLANTLVPGTVIQNMNYAWGYTDSYATDFTTYGYNVFNIDWAVNGSGTPVSLTYIDFVKVYTGQNCSGGAMLGEISTEIKGARDLHL